MVTAEVKLWDERMGAVTWITELNCASFQFDTQFLRKNGDVSPIHLPISLF